MRKAQIQNMESIAVVIIIGILIIIGIVFAFNQKSKTVGDEIEEQKDLSSFTTALRAAGLNELKCSVFSEVGNVCFDVLRLAGFSQSVSPDNDEIFKYYFDLFGESEIEIHLIHPDYRDAVTGDHIESIVIYSFQPAESAGRQSLFYPILVFDPVEELHIFSLMEVKTFT